MIVFLFTLLIASLLDVVYFFPIIHTAFFKEPEDENGKEPKIKEAPMFMLVPLTITAIFSIIFFIAFILRAVGIFAPYMDVLSLHIYDLVRIAVGNVFI